MYMFHQKLLACSVLLANPAAAGVWYVRADAGGGGDGTSWSSAYDAVQGALASAQPGDEIWVAAGTYRPGDGSSPRSVRFLLAGSVALYGGFAGTESAREERDPALNGTILSGDLLLDDGPGFTWRTDNCYHVVFADASSGGATLDGFTIRGGHANGSGGDDTGGGIAVVEWGAGGALVLDNLIIEENHADDFGGGLYVGEGNLSLRACTFRGNAAEDGGGLYTESSIDLADCVIASNHAGSMAGGILFASGSTSSLTNCHVVGNTSGGNVAGLYGFYVNAYATNSVIAYNHAEGSVGGAAVDGLAILRLRNSIVWGNTDENSTTVLDEQLGEGSYSLAFTAVQGGPDGWNDDPAWEDPAGIDGVASTPDDDFRLGCVSPYIDAGSNDLVPPGIDHDLAGNPRFLDDPATEDQGSGTAPIVDLGALEFECVCDEVSNYCLSAPNSAGAGARISAGGTISISASDFELVTDGAPPNLFGLFYYGSAAIELPFGDGWRCVGAGTSGTLRLNPPVQIDSTGAVHRLVDFTLPPAGSGPGKIDPASTWYFQFWYRDPGFGDSGFNLSDGLRVTFCR